MLGVGVAVGRGVAVGGRGVAVRVGGSDVGVLDGTSVNVGVGGSGVWLGVLVGGTAVGVAVGGSGVGVAVSTGVGVLDGLGWRVGVAVIVGAAPHPATIIPDKTMPTAMSMERCNALAGRWDL